jgi:polyisoprenoid-binding protein YceI
MNIKSRLPMILAFTALLLGAALWPVSAATIEYTIDPVHTFSEFSIRHLVISNVKGTIPDISGTILYDAEDITKSSVDVTLQVASINTHVEKRDDDLRSPEFFDVEKFPVITFKSTRVEKTSSGLMISGILTIRDIAHEVEFPFELSGPITDPWGNSRLGVQAKLTINRQDYGLTYNQVLESIGLAVGNDVNIELNVEAIKAK